MNNLINKKNVNLKCKEFSDYDEAENFCKEFYCKDTKSLDRVIVANMMTIQSHGLSLPRDEKAIIAIETVIDTFPSTPFDIIVYRGGDLFFSNRPYLSASFLKKVAFQFSQNNFNNLHKIVIKKGTKIIPLYALNQLNNIADPEMEIIFDARKLRKVGDYYVCS